MLVKLGRYWIVKAHGHWQYFKTRPTQRVINSVLRRHAKLAMV